MKKTTFRTSIGGQALIEGVMMRGPDTMAMSARLPSGEIATETKALPPAKWYRKVPFLRGSVGFVDNLLVGYTCLSWSAEKAGLDEEEMSPFEQKLQKIFGKHLMTVLMAVSGVLGMALAIFLFTLMPTMVVKWVGEQVNLGIWKAALEGGIRLVLFLAYVWGVSFLGDIHRVYQYHGAEHKSIACYEAGEELTPENAMKFPRLHPRCGTSFIFISLIISIVVFSFLSWDTVWMRVGMKFVLLPVVLGLSYEILRFTGLHDNWFTRIIAAPGKFVQKLTTAEPTVDQLEVAIASLKAAMPKEEGKDRF